MTDQNSLYRRVAVLHINTELPRGPELGVVFQAPVPREGEADDSMTVFLPDEVWEDMGSPETITASVQPGDLLNDAADG